MHKKIFNITFTGFLLLLVSCRHETDLSALPDVSFASDIQPIIASNCTQSDCHNDQDDEAFSLATYEDVIDHGGVTPGNAHKSRFYKSISNHGNERTMPPPPYAMLTSDQIKLIYLWIEQGAKNN